MTVITAKQIVLNKPHDATQKGGFDYSEGGTFKVEEFEIDDTKLAEGEVVIETVYLSNDPAQKMWIASADKNYSSGIAVGEKVPSLGLIKVIKSNDSKVAEGSFYGGLVSWATHAVMKADTLLDPNRPFPYTKLDPTIVGKLWWFVSLLGMTSLTSYFLLYETLGLKNEDDPKVHGKTFLINGAAGAVGSVALQLALNVFKASKVVAVVGGPEKVKFVEKYGDKVVGVDYKQSDFNDKLVEASGGINSIDYFVDNLGGEFLSFAVAKLMKIGGTVACCGGISTYNDPSKAVLTGSMSIVTKRLTLRGMIVSDYSSQFGEATQKLARFVKEGKISSEGAVTIKDGTGDKFKEVPVIWSGLFTGANTGKLLTRISSTEE